MVALGANPGVDVKGAIERMDLPALARLELATARSEILHVVDLQGCPRCDQLRTLSLAKLTKTPSEDGKRPPHVGAEPLLRLRLVNRAQIDALRTIGEAMQEAERATAAPPDGR